MRVGTCIANLVCVAAVTAAPPGYLRTLGPVPLRFQSVVVAVAALPPLAVQEKPNTKEANATPPPATNASPGSVTNAPASTASQPSSVLAPAANSVTVIAVQDPAVSRINPLSSDLPKVIEMLMPISRGTNGMGSMVILPNVPFTPPLPTQPASSSATYHSPPDQPITTP